MAFSVKMQNIVGVLLFCSQYVLSMDDGPIIVPQDPNQGGQEIPLHKIHQSLWETLKPWRGVAMLLFWVVLIGICGSISLCQWYCKKSGAGASMCRLLKRRDKYSDYNFVSVYSETEAEYALKFDGDTGDELDIDKIEQDNL